MKPIELDEVDVLAAELEAAYAEAHEPVVVVVGVTTNRPAPAAGNPEIRVERPAPRGWLIDLIFVALLNAVAIFSLIVFLSR